MPIPKRKPTGVPRRVKSPEGRAIELYQKGYNFREIGERLGISASTARRWIKKPQLTPLTVEGGTYITKIKRLENVQTLGDPRHTGYDGSTHLGLDCNDCKNRREGKPPKGYIEIAKIRKLDADEAREHEAVEEVIRAEDVYHFARSGQKHDGFPGGCAACTEPTPKRRRKTIDFIQSLLLCEDGSPTWITLVLVAVALFTLGVLLPR